LHVRILGYIFIDPEQQIPKAVISTPLHINSCKVRVLSAIEFKEAFVPTIML